VTTVQNRTFATYVGATAERVWESLTNPDLVSQFFFGLRLESGPKPGSPLVLHGLGPDSPGSGPGPGSPGPGSPGPGSPGPGSPGPGSVVGYVVDILPERRLMYAFTAGAPEAGPTSWLTWEIEESEPAVCRVTLSHDDLEPTADTHQDADVLRLLSNFKTLMETGRPLSAQTLADE
jgi:uncharacterized protein YndB with AHSA1/START domain